MYVVQISTKQIYMKQIIIKVEFSRQLKGKQMVNPRLCETARLTFNIFCEPKTFLALQKKSRLQGNVAKKNQEGETGEIWQ